MRKESIYGVGVMSQKGFTLIELMVALAVSAILLGLAAPNFAQMIRDNRAAAELNSFSSMLNYARGEAVRRAQRVSLAGPQAADGSWRVERVSDGEEIRQFPALTSFNLAPAEVNTLVFDAQGRLDAKAKVAFSLQVKDASLDCAKYNRAVSIELSGAVALAKAGC